MLRVAHLRPPSAWGAGVTVWELFRFCCKREAAFQKNSLAELANEDLLGERAPLFKFTKTPGTLVTQAVRPELLPAGSIARLRGAPQSAVQGLAF